MKKYIIYLFALVGLFIVACDPMEDIHNEIQKNADADYVKDTFIYNREAAPDTYVLTDEDYELSSNEDVAKYKNFSDYALPKDYLPEILNKKFTATDAYAMDVTYDYYSKPVVDEGNAYVIDEDEYAEMGQYYPNFGDEDEAEYLIGKLLDRKVYASEAGVEQTVEYAMYDDGTVVDEFVVFLYDGSNWEAKQSLMPTTEPLNYALDSDSINLSTWWADPAIKITLSAEDYLVNTETSKYGNFDKRSGEVPGTDEDKLVEMLANVLDTNYNLEENQQYLVSYAIYNGANGIESRRLIRTAGVWSVYVQ